MTRRTSAKAKRHAASGIDEEGVNMNKQDADALVRDAVAAGVAWCGINAEAGRPMMGCDPGDEQANLMLAKLLVAFDTDREVMDEALWDFAWEIDVAAVAKGKRLIATLGAQQTQH